MGTWLDTFAPAVAGEAGKLPAAGLQGAIHGQDVARQLALLEMQLKAQQQQYAQQQQIFPFQLEKEKALAEELRGKAKFYSSGMFGATADEKQAAQLGMTLQDYMVWKSQLRPTTTTVIDPNDPTKAIVVDAKRFAQPGGVIGESPRIALLSPQDDKFYAEQLLKGDTSALQTQGPVNAARIRQTARKLADERGLTGGDLAANVADLLGIKAGFRTAGTRGANIEMAVSEAQLMAPLALTASAGVDRSQYPTLNKIILAAETGTGDENVVRLGIATNSLINIYARAINPMGVATVSDKDHARELLAAAWSRGQYKAGIDQLMLELSAARKSPETVRVALREAITGEGDRRPQRPPQHVMAGKPRPPVGTVKNGYRFKGGDPSKQESWEKQ